MSAVREWAAVICLAALAATLVQNLAPSGTMERTARLVIGAFVICAILLPFAKIAPQLSVQLRQNHQAQPDNTLQSTVETQMDTAVKSSVKNLVMAELQKMGLTGENVSVNTNTLDDGSIGISKVKVVLAAKDAAQCGRAAQRLKEITGLETEVTARGG